MAWSFSSDRPVYIQIANRIKKSVLSGEYAAGQQIPAVRQLALEAAVNPNTVQKAMLLLEEEMLLVPKTTVGLFVTPDTSVIENVRNKIKKDTVWYN
jgi:DNA-binding transcriptional regulator YhcF (GntR family)